MTARPDVCAIVLAGGHSRRFGRDKLAEPIGGRSMLDRTIDAVERVAGEILVVGRPTDADARRPGVGYVPDDQPDQGPLVGLLNGLRATNGAIAVVVAGDMPRLEAQVLSELVDALLRDSAAAGAFLQAAGDPPLPMAISRGPALAVLEPAVATGERRLRYARLRLGSILVAEAAWRRHDPTGGSLLDIDTPEDLAALDGG